MSALPKIVASALRWRGVTITAPPPARHHDLMRALQGLKPMASPENQGFLTSDGHFTEREEAAQIAISAGQIKETKWGKYLFSEDLW